MIEKTRVPMGVSSVMSSNPASQDVNSSNEFYRLDDYSSVSPVLDRINPVPEVQHNKTWWEGKYTRGHHFEGQSKWANNVKSYRNTWESGDKINADTTWASSFSDKDKLTPSFRKPTSNFRMGSMQALSQSPLSQARNFRSASKDITLTNTNANAATPLNVNNNGWGDEYNFDTDEKPKDKVQTENAPVVYTDFDTYSMPEYRKLSSKSETLPRVLDLSKYDKLGDPRSGFFSSTDKYEPCRDCLSDRDDIETRNDFGGEDASNNWYGVSGQISPPGAEVRKTINRYGYGNQPHGSESSMSLVNQLTSSPCYTGSKTPTNEHTKNNYYTDTNNNSLNETKNYTLSKVDRIEFGNSNNNYFAEDLYTPGERPCEKIKASNSVEYCPSPKRMKDDVEEGESLYADDGKEEESEETDYACYRVPKFRPAPVEEVVHHMPEMCMKSRVDRGNKTGPNKNDELRIGSIVIRGAVENDEDYALNVNMDLMEDTGTGIGLGYGYMNIDDDEEPEKVSFLGGEDSADMSYARNKMYDTGVRTSWRNFNDFEETRPQWRENIPVAPKSEPKLPRKTSPAREQSVGKRAQRNASRSPNTRTGHGRGDEQTNVWRKAQPLNNYPTRSEHSFQKPNARMHQGRSPLRTSESTHYNSNYNSAVNDKSWGQYLKSWLPF